MTNLFLTDVSLRSVCVIVLINLLAYLRIVNYDYIIDDQLVPRRKWKNPIKTFWMQFNARAYSNKRVEHLQRIAVHAAVAVLIFKAFGSTTASFAAAVLFSVNPFNLNGVAWLNGIGYSMSALLTLLSLMFPILAPLCYIYSLFWHVTAINLPALFTFSNPIMLLMYPMIIGIMYLAKFRIPFGKVQGNATLENRWNSNRSKKFKEISFGKIVFVFKTYFFYYTSALFPFKLGLFPRFGYGYGVTITETAVAERPTINFVGGILLAAGNIFLMIKFAGSPIAYGLFFYHVMIAPFLNLIIMQQTITDRYTYLPNIGLMYALCSAFYMTPYGNELSCLFAGIYLCKLHLFLPAYKDMETYIDYNLHDWSDSFAAWNYKGVLHQDKGYVFGAIYHWAKGLQHNEMDVRINFNMHMMLKHIGLEQAAMHHLKIVEEGMHDEIVQERQEEIDKCEADLRKRMGLPEDFKWNQIRMNFNQRSRDNGAKKRQGIKVKASHRSRKKRRR